VQHQPEHVYDDPINAAGQRVAQAAATLAQIAATVARIAALRAERAADRDAAAAARLRALREAELAAARARWAPALDERWLRDAPLLDVGGAWGAGAPWADVDRGAAEAADRCEQRLRTLAPDAMRRYHTRREQGWDRASRWRIPRRCSPTGHGCGRESPGSGTRSPATPRRPAPQPTGSGPRLARAPRRAAR
jgi:hypothetical protein